MKEPSTILDSRIGALRAIGCGLLFLLAIGLLPGRVTAQPPLVDVVDGVQPNMVKIYGAGGVQGLEAYQSGFLISAEGHVLTVWSYVLDTDFVNVTLHDGRKFEAALLGIDPKLEIAVLKIEATDLPHFNLDAAVEANPGAKVLAFSNLYGVAIGDEPASVLHGVISARTSLAARRGAFQSRYQGEAYVLDAMTNNPGAAGGALTDRRGRLLGLLGKELRSSLNNAWLNYAIPIAALADSVADLKAGKSRPRDDGPAKKPLHPLTLAKLGILMVPDVLDKTPPFVDRVLPGSPADKAGMKADDLVMFLDGRIIQSCKLLQEDLSLIDAADEVKITVLRGQELIEFSLAAP